jgi:hypothetical protein
MIAAAGPANVEVQDGSETAHHSINIPNATTLAITPAYRSNGRRWGLQFKLRLSRAQKHHRISISQSAPQHFCPYS